MIEMFFLDCFCSVQFIFAFLTTQFKDLPQISGLRYGPSWLKPEVEPKAEPELLEAGGEPGLEGYSRAKARASS